jgi:drug/metabolite transporter (DMT)-like permease
MRRYLPLFANLLSQVLFGFCFLFIKLGMDAVGRDALKFLAFRFSLGFAFMSLLLLLRLKKVNYRDKPFYLILLCGLMNPMISQILETSSTSYAPTSLLAMVGCIMPCFVLGISVLINHEYPTRKQLIFCIVSVIGVFITAAGQLQTGGSVVIGLILIVGAQLAIASGRVFLRRAAVYFTSFETVYVTTGMGALEFWVLTTIMHGVKGDLPHFFDGLFDNPQFVVAWLYMGIGSCVFAFLLMAYASGKLPIAVSATTGTLSTIISILAGIFILREPFRPADLVGAAVILTGIVGSSLSYDSKKDNSLTGVTQDQTPS